jgi:hypothetical protein
MHRGAARAGRPALAARAPQEPQLRRRWHGDIVARGAGGRGAASPGPQPARPQGRALNQPLRVHLRRRQRRGGAGGAPGRAAAGPQGRAGGAGAGAAAGPQPQAGSGRAGWVPRLILRLPCGLSCRGWCPRSPAAARRALPGTRCPGRAGGPAAIIIRCSPTLTPGWHAMPLAAPAVIRPEQTPDQRQYDAADPDLREAAQLLQQGLQAPTVEQEEAIWTQIIDKWVPGCSRDAGAACPAPGPALMALAHHQRHPAAAGGCSRAGGGRRAAGVCSATAGLSAGAGGWASKAGRARAARRLSGRLRRLWSRRYGGLDKPWVPDVVGRAWGNRGNARSRQVRPPPRRAPCLPGRCQHFQHTRGPATARPAHPAHPGLLPGPLSSAAGQAGGGAGRLQPGHRHLPLVRGPCAQQGRGAGVAGQVGGAGWACAGTLCGAAQQGVPRRGTAGAAARCISCAHPGKPVAAGAAHTAALACRAAPCPQV